MLWWWKRKLRSKDAGVRLRALEKLGNSRHPSAVELILKALSDPERQVRQRAVFEAEWIFRRGKEPRVLGSLLVMLEDPDQYTRCRVAIALEQLGWEPKDANELFLFAFARGKWYSLVTGGADTAETLLDLLPQLDVDGRRDFSKALDGTLANTSVLPFLMALSHRKSLPGGEVLSWLSWSEYGLARNSLIYPPEARATAEEILDRQVGRERRISLQQSFCEEVLDGHRGTGCFCERCQAQRPPTDEGHDWVNCVCRGCGVKRNEGHVWDGCICKRCSTKRAEADAVHDWDGCVCRKCGRENHEWTHEDVPGRTDYYVRRCTRCGGGGPVWTDY